MLDEGDGLVLYDALDRLTSVTRQVGGVTVNVENYRDRQRETRHRDRVDAQGSERVVSDVFEPLGTFAFPVSTKIQYDAVWEPCLYLIRTARTSAR
jgi:hypothetical protein